MLGQYYYHEIIRNTIIAFGTLFNAIDIQHKKPDGTVHSSVRVPIAYGPVEKFLARLEQKPDLRQRVAITLPRLAFEMSSIQYDNSRKVSTMQTFKASTTTGTKVAKKLFMPVPYNIGFRLSVMTQYNEDALQIIEQILPYFQPSFNLTVDLVKSIGEKRDIPMVLDNLSFDDNFSGTYDDNQSLCITNSSGQCTWIIHYSEFLTPEQGGGGGGGATTYADFTSTLTATLQNPLITGSAGVDIRLEKNPPPE